MPRFTTPEYSKEVFDALERLERDCFGEKLVDKTVDWIIDLYDPESGAFYQATSAKETEDFYPDYENTAKAFYELRAFNVLKTNDLREVLTAEMADRLAEYGKKYQSEEDGFWYQPPWGRFTSESMKLYQTGCAQGLLRQTGAKPNYPPPEERVKKKEAPAESTKKELTEKELLAANKFNSKEDFKKWFDGFLPWNNTLYTSGSLLLSHGSLIESAGYREYMIELITERLDPETGFLTNGKSGKNYDAMSGTYKISNYYLESYGKGEGVEMPYPEKLLESTAEVLLSDEPECHGCHIANAWALMRNSIQSQKDPSPKLISRYLELLPVLLDKTREKILALRSPEGIYSYMPGVGSWGNQGMPAALPLWEGETSGVSMVLAARGHIYNALMLPRPELKGSRTIEEVVELLGKVPPTVKIKPSIGCNYDFSSFDEGVIPQKQGFRHTGDVSIAVDPATGKRSVRIAATGYDSPVFNIDAGTVSGRGFACEYDIRFDLPSVPKNAELIEIRFGTWNYAARLSHKTEGEGLRLTGFSTRSEALGEVMDRECYHHIRLEYLPDGEGSAEVKVFSDGKYIGSTENWKGTHALKKPAVDNIHCVTFRTVPALAYTAYISNFSLTEL